MVRTMNVNIIYTQTLSHFLIILNISHILFNCAIHRERAMEESKSNPPRTTGPNYKEVCGIYIVQWYVVQIIVYTMAHGARVAFSGIDLVL